MMILPRSLLVWIPMLLAACGPQSDGAPVETPVRDPAVAAAAAKLVDAMRVAIASLLASPEHGDEEIEIRHVLVGFKGSTKPTDATLSNAEAEELAAEIFARAKKGEDFTALMTEYSNDPGPGTYPMTKKGRADMVPGFGNVGFRLQPGMVGVAPFHPTDSPYGWHIIKRLK